MLEYEVGGVDLRIVITGYCIISDLILVFQFMYYKIRHHAVLRQMAAVLKEGEISPVRSTSPTILDNDLEQTNQRQEYQRLPVCFIGVTGLTLTAVTLTSMGSIFNDYAPQQPIVSGVLHHSRRLLEWKEYDMIEPEFIQSDPLDGAVTKVGYALGWVSTSMYLLSRIPQIFRNVCLLSICRFLKYICELFNLITR
ncbi:unnamed protein product [Trichobilharzia regenti]|nr:unnamed protein product [Trichobilharzia regenti]